MRRSSRLQAQARAFWSRTPDNNLRVNSPDGFLHDYLPVGWDNYGAAVAPGGWYVGSDTPGAGLTAVGPSGPFWGPSGRTTGSPLTKPERVSAGVPLLASLPPAVTRCTGVIVNGIRSTPLLVERDGQVLPLPQWITDPMGADTITGPTGSVTPAGRRLTGSAFWATVLTHAVWFGFGPFMFEENIERQPIPGSLRLLNPYMVGVSDDGRFELLGDDDMVLGTDLDGRFTVGGVVYRIMALRGLPPNNGSTPEGVLSRHFDVLRLSAVIHMWGERVFGSGVPSGYLKVASPQMTQDDADKLKAKWMAAHGGDRRSVAVLNAVTDYVKMSWSAQEMDTSALKHDVNREIALMFQLDPVYVGEGTSGMEYNNQNDRRRDLIDLTVTAWGQQLTETITAILPLGTVCRLDWTRFTASDLITQGPVVMALWQSGLINRDEGRGQLGLVPDGGPEFQTTEVSGG